MNRLIRFSLFLLLLSGTVGMATAQSLTITGRVIDKATGESLPTVNVFIVELNRGSATNIEGRYEITVPSGTYTLEASFIGYRKFSTRVTVGTQNVTLNIELDPSLLNLDELIVVGFGTQSRATLTGSIAQVSGEEIENTPVNSFESAIQGRAAGVFVESTNGKLGQGIKMRIRGSSSVTASNQPLYVIDGIPVTTDNFSINSAQTNPMADFNFNDVESIEILKDAAAAAIYGSRASNGVVLITTKKGRAGRTNFSINYMTGLSMPTRYVEWMNAEEYVNYFLDAAQNSDDIENDNFWVGFVEARFNRYSAGTDWRNYAVDEDWQAEAFQNAPMNAVDFSANGGNDKTRFYVNGTYSDQTGILIKNSFERIGGRVNLDHTANDWLTLGVNMNISRSLNFRLADDNAFSTPLQLVAMPPIQPVIDPRTGELSGNFTLYYNGLLHVDNSDFLTTVFRNFGNAYGDIKLMPELTFRSELGVDILTQNEERWYGSLTARNVGEPNGFGDNRWVQVLNMTTNNFFNYNKLFNNVHRTDVVLGTTYQVSYTKTSYVAGRNFPNDSFKKLASAADISGGSSTGTRFTNVGYFSRINYAYNDKYLLGITGRIDGSSRFGANARYGFFPSFSVGWILSQEDFLAENGLISFLKIRASYGSTGNDGIGNNPSLGLFAGDGSYAGSSGLRPSQSPNPDLKWEQTTSIDVGLDFGLFDGFLSGEIGYYNKKTTDLLLGVNVPATTGFLTQLRNVGELENNGVEFVLNTNKNFNQLQWNSSFNISANRNKITNLDGQIIEGGYLNRAVEGEALGVFFGKKYAGVDPANGDALYYLNGKDGATTNDWNEAERGILGSPNPDFIGGFSNNLNYKGFEIGFLFQWVYGNEIYNGGGRFQSVNGDWFDNQTRDQLNSWKQPGDITDIPQARFVYGNGSSESSRWLYDGSYLRLKNATIGYTLPSKVVSDLNLTRVRLYLSGTNLLTFTKYKGWDPEVNTDYLASNLSQGNDFYAAPQPKTITAGINIGF